MKRTELRRRTPLHRARPLRARSLHRIEQDKARKRLMTLLLAAQPLCAICGARQATDGHERLTRARGGSALDPANIVLTCRECHILCHDRPAWATAAGWLTPSWERAQDETAL